MAAYYIAPASGAAPAGERQDRYAAGRIRIVRATTLYGNAPQRTFRTLTTPL
jgi:hypothetical protein